MPPLLLSVPFFCFTLLCKILLVALARIKLVFCPCSHLRLKINVGSKKESETEEVSNCSLKCSAGDSEDVMCRYHLLLSQALQG